MRMARGWGAPAQVRIAALCALLVLALDDAAGFGICEKFDTDALDGSNPKDYCKYQIDNGTPPKQGDVCLSHPEDVTPTQAAFGEVDAACAQRYLEDLAARKDGSLRDELSDKLAPGILGPGGKVYITDHHHLSTALLRAFLPYQIPMHHRTLFVCVTQDMSSLEEGKFWEIMKDNELVWLHDERGNNITVADLPISVKSLKDDPFRTLALYIRQSYGIVKCGGKATNKIFPQCKGGAVQARPFIEFRWANEFRKLFYSTGIYRESDQAQVMAFEAIFNDVMKFTLSDDAKHLEGWNEMMPQFTDLVTIDEYGCVEDDYTAHLEHSERFWTTHPPTEHPGRARRKRRGEGRVGTPALAEKVAEDMASIVV